MANNFIHTIYLGDRYLIGLYFEAYGPKEQTMLKLYINEISRVRNPNGNWDFYNDENVIDGCLVFTDVSYFEISPGFLPNGYIEIIEATEQADGKLDIEFSIDTVYVDNDNVIRDLCKMKITYKGLYIETKDGEKITE